MSNTDQMLYEQCKDIAETLEKLEPNGFWTEETEDEESEFYFDDVYNVDYVWRHRVGLIGVRIMVAFGGPNIWVDTFEGYVCGYWGGEAKYPLSYKVCDAINDYYREYAAENIYADYQAGNY